MKRLLLFTMLVLFASLCGDSNAQGLPRPYVECRKEVSDLLDPMRSSLSWVTIGLDSAKVQRSINARRLGVEEEVGYTTAERGLRDGKVALEKLSEILVDSCRERRFVLPER
jgi:hypothetical protein